MVVMDIQMPRLDGIEATRFLTSRDDERQGRDADHERGRRHRAQRDPRRRLGLPAQGSGAEEVQNAVRAAAAGGMVFGASLAGKVAAYFTGAAPKREEPFPDLTDREREVLRHAGRREVQRRHRRAMYVSNKTVRNTVSAIYAKLHAAGRAEAIVKAREAGYGRD